MRESIQVKWQEPCIQYTVYTDKHPAMTIYFLGIYEIKFHIHHQQIRYIHNITLKVLYIHKTFYKANSLSIFNLHTIEYTPHRSRKKERLRIGGFGSLFCCKESLHQLFEELFLSLQVCMYIISFLRQFICETGP